MILDLIPEPKNIELKQGVFSLSQDTRILYSAGLDDLAEMVTNYLPFQPVVAKLEESSGNFDNSVQLKIDPSVQCPIEGYKLLITSDQILITGTEISGVFYGFQTLRQLISVGSDQDINKGISLPCLEITDQPEFQWRGLHLDVSRHMFSIDFIKKFLDLMALHKLNRFHWHLTDDQGWRIEINQYPKLVEIGSRRKSTPYPHDRSKSDGEPYEGFYTQAQIREIIDHAAKRQITIVPEIEMPGHALAALAAYPELGCIGSGYEVCTTWGMQDDVFCAGNERVFSFLENVLDEVIGLFPGEFIHIGGDECPKTRWISCSRCQQRIQDQGLEDEYELQSYFIKRIETHLMAKGRRLIGWDEILEGGLAPNAAVMSWRGSEGGIQAANAGHDVVLTPNTHCYFDYYQSMDYSSEPPAIGGYLPLEKVYEFDPREGVNEEERIHVLGGQGNIWTEFIPTGEQVEYMTYPRACALSEVLWAGAGQEYQDFIPRLTSHLVRLANLGVNYRPLDE